jgi:GDPmannose 4,6-dehydratase
MKKKVALITGITGQDGSYLTELLIKKNYTVHGIIRKSSSFNTGRIDHIYQGPQDKAKKLFLHYGDLSEINSIIEVIKKYRPNEIYNLGAQSHVAVSFKIPEYTANINALGTLRILEAIKFLKLANKCRFYQASSSELYGLIQNKKQKESTPFYPRSPYAISKLFSYWVTRHYREAYGFHASNGILFNHESKRRGLTFVTKKVTNTLAKIFYGLDNCIYIGNLNSKRDWGHAKDYVEMQWKILQQKKPDDYVIATGKQYSVRDFINMCFNYIGIKIEWRGKGLSEYAVVQKIINKENKKIFIGQIVVKVDKTYYRPLDVENLLGDGSKAKKKLNWKPKYKLSDIVSEMMEHDLQYYKFQVNDR